MALPPSKRQKRHVILSSDDDVPTPPSKPKIATRGTSRSSTKLANGESAGNRSLPTRSRTKEKSSQSAHPDPSSSLERRPQTSTVKTTVNSTLHSFFNAASQAPLVREKPRSDEQTPEVEEAEEDVIEDDSADEPLHKVSGKLRSFGSTTGSILDRRKPLREKPQNHILVPGQEKAITASQRFLPVGHAPAKDAFTQTQVEKDAPDTRPWAEKYGPASLEELMVHKKKVADVRGWLDGVLQGRDHKRLLILKGPSGAGKTATISALAKTMDLDISEWKNPVDTDFSSENYLSASAQFEDFLGRSGKFGSLRFSDGIIPAGPIMDQETNSTPNSNRNNLILIEEFPNTFTSTSQALRSFRTSIQQYLASNAPFPNSIQFSNQQHASTIHPLVMIITETSTSTSSLENFTAHRLLGPDILSHPSTSMIEFNPIAPTLLMKALERVLQKEARHSGRRRIPGPSVLKQLAEIGDVRSAIGSLEFLCLRSKDGDDWSGRVAAKPKRGASNALTKMEKESLALVSQRESTLGLFHAVGKVVYNKREDAHPSLQEPLIQPPAHLRPQHARSKVSEVDVERLLDETGTDPHTFIAALHENYIPSCEGTTFIDSLNDSIDALSDTDLLASSERARSHSQASESLRQTEIAFQVAVRGLLFALPYPVKRASHPHHSQGGGGIEAYKMRYPTSLKLRSQMEEVENLVLSIPSPTSRPLALLELLLDRLPYMAQFSPPVQDFLGRITSPARESMFPLKKEREREKEKLWLSDDDIED